MKKTTELNSRTKNEIWPTLRDRYFSSTKSRACPYVAAFSKSVHSISNSRVARSSREKNELSFNFKINVWITYWALEKKCVDAKSIWSTRKHRRATKEVEKQMLAFQNIHELIHNVGNARNIHFYLGHRW
jgi:hypothetical protein